MHEYTVVHSFADVYGIPLIGMTIYGGGVTCIVMIQLYALNALIATKVLAYDAVVSCAMHCMQRAVFDIPKKLYRK